MPRYVRRPAERIRSRDSGRRSHLLEEGPPRRAGERKAGQMRNELASPTRVRQTLDGLGLVPSKMLGQNFLIDANILEIIVHEADLRGSDRVLEIGPGLGIVTAELAHRAGHVLAMEKDRVLFDFLVERFGSDPDVTLAWCDALETLEAGCPTPRCNKMVSNLPYNVASRLLVELAGNEKAPDRMVVTVQEEVARRLAAIPGDGDYGVLSVRVQLRYDATIVKKVSPTCFVPRPRVGSMVVRLDRVRATALPDGLEEMFERVTKHAFAHRRKQMRGILAHQWPGTPFTPAEAEALLSRAGVANTARPESLAVAQWLALAGALCTVPQASGSGL